MLVERFEDLRFQNHLLSKLYPRTTTCLYIKKFTPLSEKLVPKEIDTPHLEKEREKMRKNKLITNNM